MKPKQLIKDVTFDFDKDETKCGPHIAYTLPSQGGAASGLNVGYLFKSDDVSEQTVKEAEEIQKAMSMKNHKMLLENALKEAYCDKDEWLCVEDWKEGQVYFTTGDYCEDWDFMVTTFTMTEDGQVTVGDTASPVVQITDYMIVDGKVKLSEEAEDKLETGMYEIVSKSVNKADVQLKLFKAVTEFKESLEKASTPIVAVSDDINVNKTKENTEKPLDFQELMKSSEFQDLLKAQLEAAQAPLKEELEKAQAKITEADEILKAAAQVQQNEFTDIVKSSSFIPEDKVESMVSFLMKSRKTSEHDLVLEVIKNANTAIAAMQEEITKTKDQFALSEKGKDGKIQPLDIDPQELIKAKAANLFPEKSK